LKAQGSFTPICDAQSFMEKFKLDRHSEILTVIQVKRTSGVTSGRKILKPARHSERSCGCYGFGDTESAT
jgi:hypothetical protein